MAEAPRFIPPVTGVSRGPLHAEAERQAEAAAELLSQIRGRRASRRKAQRVEELRELMRGMRLIQRQLAEAGSPARLSELLAERLAELAKLEAVMLGRPDGRRDKQLRQRSGSDDHLELGEAQRARPARKPQFPVSVYKSGQ